MLPQKIVTTLKISSSKYYDIEEMHNIEMPHKNKWLSLFHINSCSLNKNFDELQLSLVALKKWHNSNKWARIRKKVSTLYTLSLNEYSFEFTVTETSAGGTCLYIASHLSCKFCNDLNIYKKNELESTVIEIVNSRKTLLWESFTHIHQWILLTLIAITKTNY